MNEPVMDAVGQGLTVTDADGRFEYVNPAYAHGTTVEVRLRVIAAEVQPA